MIGDVVTCIVTSGTYRWDANNKYLHDMIMEYYWLNSELLDLDRRNYPHCELSLKADTDQPSAYKGYYSEEPKHKETLLDFIKSLFDWMLVK